jgi:hypothetical protein
LVIIDSLRAFRPDAELKSDSAARLMGDLRRWARAYNVAFLIIHHIRKPDEKFGQDALEDVPVMTWLQKASGARALINQSDVRIAFDSTPGLRRLGQLKGSAKAASDDIGLVMKGFGRVRGEFGPVFLRRVVDEEGAPKGYVELSGLELLFNPEHEEIFRKLPDSFSFKQAKQAYGKQDQATHDWLRKLQRIGALKHAKGGPYIKVAEYAESER